MGLISIKAARPGRARKLVGALRLNIQWAGGGRNMRSQSDDVRAGVLNARHQLSVDVENGWVTVSGMVDLPYQRTCAESDARGVPGVVGVTNLIRLMDADRVEEVTESRQ
jgi:hypothetical protein